MTSTPVPDLVSVGMSAYNNAGTIEHAIRSLLAQTECNIEISIIDANSTDATPQICERLARQDSRIRFRRLAEQRRWYLNARDHLAEARGEYFMWADADDLWSPAWVKDLKSVLADEGLGAAFGVVAHIDSQSCLMPNHIAHGRVFTFTSVRPASWRVLRYIADPDAAGKPNLIYSLWRTETLRKIDPWREAELSRDLDIFFLVRALRSTRIGSSETCAVFRRIPTTGEPQGPPWESEAGDRTWRHPKSHRILRPSGWPAWRVDPGYRDRYLEILPPIERPLASMVLFGRGLVAYAARAFNRLQRSF
jgi:glycosyltransferase involved in cell wall biosynthesis